MFSIHEGDINLSLFVFILFMLFSVARYDRFLVGKIIHKYTVFYYKVMSQ